jgi:hypothetical protein
MIQIVDGLYVGNDMDCRNGDDEYAVVHACKSPCHQRAVGYRGSLKRDHPNYLVLENGTDLYLNLVDPPVPLFMPESFTSFLSFARAQLEAGRKILIHCNQGESRAPSLALLVLAKITRQIPDDSYEGAKAGFEELFAEYHPGRGIQKYLIDNWGDL